MSRDSYNHLKRHLQEKKQKLLLNIVQEHLFIDGRIPIKQLDWIWFRRLTTEI